MAKLHYAVRVTTDEALYDETYGMSATGVFTWISGNPGFTGTGYGGATGEAGLTGVDCRWNEGWITDGGLGMPTREIDVTIAGGYGTQSGFTFNLADSKAGASSQFRKFVQDNDIKFCGRKVELFTCIDKVFYQTWAGQISNNPLDETDFKFQCVDTYKQVHKMLPPTIITESAYPYAKAAWGKAIPVCFGDIPRAECLQVQDDTSKVPLCKTGDSQLYDSCPAWRARYNMNYPFTYPIDGWTGVISYYDLWTYGIHFYAEDLNDGTYYLKVNNGVDVLTAYSTTPAWIEDGPDMAQLVPILSNDETLRNDYPTTTRQQWMTRVYVKEGIYGHNGYYDQGVWERHVAVPYTVALNPQTSSMNTDNYWFSIIRLPTKYIVSNSAISGFVASKTSQVQLYYWDRDTLVWEDVSHQVLDAGEVDAQGHQTFRAPHGLYGESLIPKSEGENYASVLCWQIPKLVVTRVNGASESLKSLGNRLTSGMRSELLSVKQILNTGTSSEMSTVPPPTILGASVPCLDFDLYITDELRENLKDAGLSQLFILPDMKAEQLVSNGSVLWQIYVTAYAANGVKLTLNSMEDWQTSVWFPSNHDVGGGSDLYKKHSFPLIPTKYYRMLGWDCTSGDDMTGTWTSDFEKQMIGTWTIGGWREWSYRLRCAWELRCLSELISDKRIQKIHVMINMCRGGNATPAQLWSLRWYQFALVGLKSIDIHKQGLYTKLCGELRAGRKTNTVYQAFRKLLEDYDGISADDLEYNNLPWTRDEWHVGRQITEQKNSFEYIEELARQSFVGIFPTRKGKRRLSAWREDVDDALQHNESTIARGGIENMQQTPLSQCFNTLEVKYSWNPGSEEYENAFFVSKVNETAFPGVTGAWSDYVGGRIYNADKTTDTEVISGASAYPDCKALWTFCHDSWLRTKTISKDLGTDWTELPWYINYAAYDSASAKYQGVDSSAWMYLQNLAQWATRQKYEVTYRLPLTAANLQACELLEPVQFKDKIWTSDETLNGWIIGVAVDCREDQLVVTSMLQPNTIAVDSDDLVMEIGSVYGAYTSDGLYEETGGADQMIETGVV